MRLPWNFGVVLLVICIKPFDKRIKIYPVFVISILLRPKFYFEKEGMKKREKMRRKRRNREEGYFQRNKTFFCRNCRRGISETKKVSHRIASGISLFALHFLPLLFAACESFVSRLQRFSTRFFLLNGHSWDTSFLLASFVTSLSYNFISHSFFLLVIGIYRVTRRGEKRFFF